VKRFVDAIRVGVGSNIHFVNLLGDQHYRSAAEMHESIFSAVNRMSNMIASLPFTLYDQNYQEPADCSGYNLIKYGFRYFTPFSFFKDVDVLRHLTGNGRYQIFRDYNGQIVDFGLIRPGCSEPLIDLDSGELYYAVTAVDNRLLQQTMYVHCSEILDFGYTRFGQTKSINPMKVLSGSLDYDQQIRRISLSQLFGTNEGIIVHFDGNMQKSEKEAVIDSVANFYKDNGGLLVEENGSEIKRFERTLVDTNLIEVDKVTRSRVAMVFNLPEHFLGDTGSSFATLEQMNLEYVTGNLVPTLTQYEQELDRKLLTQSQRQKGYHFKFDTRGLLRADTATRGEFYQIGIRNMLFRPNEIRIWEGLPPDPDPNANKLYVSGDLYPIDTPIAERNAKKGGGSESDPAKI
jgi:HK97 family phage portal protein